MRRILGIILSLVLLMVSSAFADSAVDVLMNVGTTQAFTEEAVPAEDLETILRAGLAAASAINQQPWVFVAVTNSELMQELAGSGMSFTPPAGAEGKPEGDSGAASEGKPEGMPAAPAASGGAKASLGDSPAAIIIYKNGASKSPNPDFDCGLATQNMVIAAASLGYGVKIVSSPTMTLNGANHDALCEKMGVDTALDAVAVLLIGRTDETVDGATGATTRDSLDVKTRIIE